MSCGTDLGQALGSKAATKCNAMQRIAPADAVANKDWVCEVKRWPDQCSLSSSWRKIMLRLVSILTLVAGLAGCVAAPPDGYGPDYYAPRTSIGIGVGAATWAAASVVVSASVSEPTHRLPTIAQRCVNAPNSNACSVTKALLSRDA